MLALFRIGDGGKFSLLGSKEYVRGANFKTLATADALILVNYWRHMFPPLRLDFSPFKTQFLLFFFENKKFIQERISNGIICSNEGPPRLLSFITANEH